MGCTRPTGWLLVAYAVDGWGSGESSAGPPAGVDAAGVVETSSPDTGVSQDASAPGDAGGPDVQGPVAEAGDPSFGLASQHPCDQGIAADPAVVWAENFEEGAVNAVTSRYDSANNPPGMTLVADVPAKSCGKASMKLTSVVNANATDLYKRLPAHVA